MKEINDNFGHWFAGFSDGEGCFVISKHNRENPRTNYGCEFRIQLRDDDKSILEKIHDTLGIGYILNLTRPSENHSQPSTAFYVGAIKECAMIVKVFNKYPLQAKKQNDFAIWKQAVAELQKPRGERNADLLEYYFQKIQAVRKYKKESLRLLAQPKTISLQLTIEW